jgi:hypothetical protein
MNPLQLLFTAAIFGTIGVALWKGGWPERSTAIALLCASLATPLVESSVFSSPEYGILAVDLLLLGWLGALALGTDRFWPLWATGFHLVGTVIHVARMVDPTVVPNAYALGQVFWSYPVLAALASGALVEAPAARARNMLGG